MSEQDKIWFGRNACREIENLRSELEQLREHGNIARSGGVRNIRQRSLRFELENELRQLRHELSRFGDALHGLSERHDDPPKSGKHELREEIAKLREGLERLRRERCEGENAERERRRWRHCCCRCKVSGSASPPYPPYPPFPPFPPFPPYPPYPPYPPSPPTCAPAKAPCAPAPARPCSSSSSSRYPSSSSSSNSPSSSSSSSSLGPIIQ
jgi:hypothetical protein